MLFFNTLWLELTGVKVLIVIFEKYCIKWAKISIFCNKIGDFAKNFWQFFLLFCSEFGEDKIDVAGLFAEIVVGGADAEAREFVRTEFGDTGFKAVIAASAALFAEAKLAEV